MKRAGVNISFPTMGDSPLWAHQGPQPTAEVDLFDTTYADEEAAMLTFAS